MTTKLLETMATSSPIPFMPLEPLDESLLTSKGRDMSSARQRRRNSTRKAGPRNLSQSQKGLELTSLKSSGSPRSQPSGRIGVSHPKVEGVADVPGITRSSNIDRLQGAYTRLMTLRDSREGDGARLKEVGEEKRSAGAR